MQLFLEQDRIHGCGRVGRGGNARFPSFRLVSMDGPTDGRTDGRTDKASYRVACPRLKRKRRWRNDRQQWEKYDITINSNGYQIDNNNCGNLGLLLVGAPDEYHTNVKSAIKSWESGEKIILALGRQFYSCARVHAKSWQVPKNVLFLAMKTFFLSVIAQTYVSWLGY